MNVSKLKKSGLLLSAIIFITLMVLRYADSSKQAANLNNKGSFTVGQIYDADFHRVYYKFKVEGRIYKSSSPYDEGQAWLCEIGREVLVRYFSDNPKLNRLVIINPEISISHNFLSLADSLKNYEFTWWDIGNSYP